MTSERDFLDTVDIGELFPNRVDFPRVGFNFPDITPILEKRPDVFSAIIAHLVAIAQESTIDAVACIESFGYLFGVPIALSRNCPLVLIRRPGKLPRPCVSVRYRMCYDDDRRLEAHADAITRGSRILVVDDFLASGGTAVACGELIHALGASVAAFAFVVELPALGGARPVSRFGAPVHSVLSLTFDPERGVWSREPRLERVREAPTC